MAPNAGPKPLPQCRHYAAAMWTATDHRASRALTVVQWMSLVTVPPEPAKSYWPLPLVFPTIMLDIVLTWG